MPSPTAPARILALADDSPYADDVLRMAHRWSRWTGAELHVLSEAMVVMPGLLDNAAKARAQEQATEQAREGIARKLEAVVGGSVTAPSVRVVGSGLLDDARRFAEENPGGVIVAGIKGAGILRRIFIGSIVVKLIDQSTVPVIAVPRGEDVKEPLHLHIAVPPDGTFRPEPVQELIARLGPHVGRATFFTMVDKAAEETATMERLRGVDAVCRLNMPTSLEVLCGEGALAGLKERAAIDPHAVLVLRKGGRELSDQLFRRFFINELVYEARVPLVVLP